MPKVTLKFFFLHRVSLKDLSFQKRVSYIIYYSFTRTLGDVNNNNKLTPPAKRTTDRTGVCRRHCISAFNFTILFIFLLLLSVHRCYFTPLSFSPLCFSLCYFSAFLLLSIVYHFSLAALRVVRVLLLPRQTSLPFIQIYFPCTKCSDSMV